MSKYQTSGYCHCACPTCFDLAIASAGDESATVLCLLCQDAGCEAGVGECQRTDDDMDEDERDEEDKAP